jgi:15-cis-phytoene synthase
LLSAADVSELDSLVRRVDPDRWLASRFIADEGARADVIALYAFDYEISRVHKVTTQPLLGEIRLTWWAEAVAEIFEGRPVRRHPVTLALAEAVARHGLPRASLDVIIDARLPELEGQPADALASTTAIMTLATSILGAGQANVAAAAHAWATQAAAHLVKANRDLHDLPSAAFPAVAYASLVRSPNASPIGKRLRLAWAVLRGRL